MIFKNLIKIIPSLLILMVVAGYNCQAQGNFNIRDAATNLDTPWEMVWGPNDWIWFTGRQGTVKKVDPVKGDVQLIAEIQEVVEQVEGGLMGMVLHPSFEDTSQVFIAYNYFNSNNDYQVKVMRYTYANDTFQNPTTIIDDIEGNNIHDGCRLMISPDRNLYITTGDAGKKNQYPQDNQSVNGKVLRLNLDGSVPADNPIPGNPMWSKGHRNAQGLVMANGIIYSSEHGPSNDDEFNIIKKGRNYGWPQVEGFCDNSSEQAFCQDSNVVEPLKAWTPPEAVCGIDYYGQSRIAQWNNSILMATLGFSQNDGRTLFELELNAQGNQVVNTNKFFENQFGRLRDVLVAPDGKVYIATSNKDGRGNPGSKDDRIVEIDATATGNENANEASIMVYPNPFSGSVKIELPHYTGKGSLRLFNADGQKVYEEEVNGYRTINLNNTTIEAGVYLLKFDALSKKIVKKVVMY